MRRGTAWNVERDRGEDERGREPQTGEVCSLSPAIFILSSAACAHAKGVAKTPLLRWQNAGSSRRQGAKSVRADWRRVPSTLFQC